MSSKIEKYIDDAVDDLNGVFWDRWIDYGMQLPDTRDGDELEIIIPQTAILNIILHYLLRFKKEHRVALMQQVIQNIRLLEKPILQVE